MNQAELLSYLDDRGVDYRLVEHDAVMNMNELNAVDGLDADNQAKNLFVRDDKKRDYYLIVVKDDKRVDLKEVRSRFETRRLSFASADDLMDKLQLTGGSVTPLGLLNDETRSVHLIFDEDFLQEPGLIGVHPNINTATVVMQAQDLLDLIQEHGNPVTVAPL